MNVYHNLEEIIRKQCPGGEVSTYRSGAIHLAQFIQSVFGREMKSEELTAIISNFIESLQQYDMIPTTDLGDPLDICVRSFLKYPKNSKDAK